MALKRVYRVKMSLYIYSIRNFLPYPMWDVINTPHADITSSLCLTGLWGQTNKQTPPMGPNKLSHWGWKSALIRFIMTRTQPCKYCPL